MKKKILILTVDAGTGHRRASEAVKSALDELYGDRCETLIENPLQNPDIPDLVKMIEAGYDEMVTEGPTLYQLAYTATDAPVVAQLIHNVTTAVLNKSLTKLVQKHLPDIVVTTYPAFTQAAMRAGRDASHLTPVDVIVTDLIGVHSLWFEKRAEMTFVPTGQVYKQALEQGLLKTRVHLTGLPIHPTFACETREPTTVRRELGWEPDKLTALIVGSARASDPVTIAQLLDRSGLDLQVAVVSGGYPEAEARLKHAQWKTCVFTYGYVENLPEMMHAADFIVCKAGGLVVTEALACGLPLVLYDALPGQESGNVQYVVNSDVGTWSPGPIGVLTTAYAWLAKDRQEFLRHRTAARRIGKPRAAYEVAEQIFKQICSHRVREAGSSTTR